MDRFECLRTGFARDAGDIDQAQRLDLLAEDSPAVSVEPDGWLVSGIDIEVVRR